MAVLEIIALGSYLVKHVAVDTVVQTVALTFC